MRQQVCKNKSWKKRVAAAGMAICMACTMPFSVQAENVTEEYNVQEDYSTESAAENLSDEKLEVQSYDIETAQTVNQEDSAAEEPSKEEVQLSLQLVAVENTDTTTPNLKLEEADKLSENITVKKTDSNTSIEVKDGKGLILLSNVKPEEYANCEVKLITTSGWDLTNPVKVGVTTEVAGTEYSFLGLGSDDNPYAGTFGLDSGTDATKFSISTTRPLFNALSVKATFNNTIPFSIAESTKEPLLAKTLKVAGSGDGTEGNSALKCDIELRNSNTVTDAAIGGLIGTMEGKTRADITFTNQLTNELKISGTDHVGLFCNTMNEGSSLTATLKNGAGKISVAATESGKDAGGFVGHMETDASLTIAGTSVYSVASSSGNAGGIVGSSVDGSVTVKDNTGEETNGTFQFADSITLSAGNEKAAGGLIGEYNITKSIVNTSISFDLSKYKFNTVNISGGKNVGGLFGELIITNTAETDGISVSISGNTETFDNNTKTITTEVSSAVTNYGGLIGSYQSSNMKNTLKIEKTAIATTGGEKLNNESSYGGVIGKISGNSYVAIENVYASTGDMKVNGKASFGGLVGKINDGFLNVGSVTLKTAESYDLAGEGKNTANDAEGRGGLVGHLVKGVLRLHGTTDLSEQKITAAYNHVGQIVGNNGNGLVYALGNGNALSENKEGWSLIRYNGTDRSGSDIGNWGAVVRLGNKLTEGVDGALTFDQQAHTVTVNNGTGENVNINNTNAFAAYALAFDLSSAYTNNANSALKFKYTVNAANTQTVTLTGDIDLTGTGILGIGKDSTEKNEKAQTFTGTFNGGNYKITLDIGSVYGNVTLAENNSTPNAAGQLYAKRSDQQDTHYSLALIPFAGDVTISNLTIAGNVNCKIPKTVNQEETNIKYPAFVASAIGLASGKTAFNNVTVNTIVSVTEEATETTVTKKLLAWQGGFLARCEGSTLSFTSCKWGYSASLDDERNTDSHRIGGLAAEVMGGCTVTVKDCILSGSITSKSIANANVGGLIAVSRGEDSNNNSKLSTINISNLQVNGEKVTTLAATTSGGLLGYQWKNTNVEFATADSTENADAGTSAAQSGVTIYGSTLNANTAQFGGLVYQATGYWNATAQDSIVFTAASGNASDTQQTGTNVNTFTGKSVKDTPSGLLVGTGLITKEYTENGKNKKTVESALYLETGTWGDAVDAAYKIDSGAVTLSIDSADYFDELVGITKFNDAGNSNAVVSLAVRDNGNAAKIDTGKLNTYTGQIDKANYKNDKTRYYYNLDSYRKSNSALNLDSVSTPENLVLWSVAQYAAPNIRGCFRKGENTDVTITDKIDLKGYSYYPVTPIGAVNLGNNQGELTSLTFDYDGMNEKENENKNKKLSDSDHQHYLMQHGLFYNAYRNIAVKNTSFLGTVGKEPVENSTIYNSGALIYGSVVGDPVNYIVEITLNKVTLAGIRVTGVEKDKVTYAPLLINQMEQAVKLTVDTLSTGEGYTTENDSERTVYAATSLIGNVGNIKATKLTLSFSNIALDGRLNEDASKATSVLNNGNVTVEYNTTHTIFTNATLLESFMYSSEGSGTYNFNSTDKMVTYGVELTNTGSNGRNPDKQYQYYDGEIYITDEKDKTADEVYVKGRYKDTNFIRYVHIPQNIINSQYELDINQKTSGLLKGCGTYGDPYIIEDAHQLSSLAAYIEKPESVKKFQAVFNSKVLNEKKQTAESYHIAASTTDNTNTQDICYTWDGSTWKQDTQEGTTIETDTVTKYLLNAYYKIDKDITLSAESFSGLGTKDNPFSGVIVGTQNIEVKITGTNSNKDSFGGLIAYSRGSVVKDLKVDYTSATIKMQADTLPETTKNPFFGGVVGYCMGGDTIIDNVSVNYEANSVTFISDNYEYMIAAGGYVGLVGGATHVTEDSDYEKTGGGVVFRNMTETTNTFTTVCAEAAYKNKTVNMEDVDANKKAGKSTTDGGNYFYRNPYVGRVLDGYACAEECTINNTDKNYTIPTLTLNNAKNDLQVTEENGILTATVTSAQGLWLLSAIVNSGAGAMDSSGSYTDVDSKVVDAYQYGKPRTASYDGIGEAAGTDAATLLTDEKYWGGIASTAGNDEAKKRVSYLVKNYTSGTTAARLAGKSSSADTNNPVNLTFNADTDNSIDMTTYGNGFRGIGCSYGDNKKVWKEDCSIPKVYRRNLLVNSINADNTTRITITLNINQNDYKNEYDNGSWINQGAGLFVDFHFTNGCEVKNLQIFGNVRLGLFEVKKENALESTLTCVTKREDEKQIGVGGFAARTANSQGKVTFSDFALSNIYVYGGTMTGGAIGYIDGYNKSSRNVTFKNWSINSGIIARWIYNTDCTGGLVGWYNGYGTLEIVGNEIKSNKTNVNDFSVMTIANAKNQASSGGIVGASDYGSVQFENIIVEKMIVTGENLRSLGGLIGEGRQGNKFSSKNCTLKNITVKSNLNSENIGGVIGYHDKETVIEEVTITENSFVYGQQYVGGFVGNSSTTANGTLKIIKCKETDTNIQAEWNWVGGFVGYLSANRTAMFQECQESSVNILGRYVGGLIGAVDGNITASNVEFNTVKVITKANNGGRNAGLLTGNTDNLGKFTNKILGYNILAKDCKVGYSNVGFDQLATAKIEQLNTTGLWIGNNGAGTTTNLIAVSASGNVFPQIDIGIKKNTTTKPTIIYTDKTAEQAYKPTESTAKPSSSANPWLDVNPKSGVPFADGTVMTGNGVGTGTANTILSELKKETLPADYYWNLEDNKDELVEFLDSTNDAYITTYRAEERATTTVSENVDFPVLVVNNSAEVDAMLWNYIAAMTNVSSGYIAKTQIKSITAKSYKWDATAKNFKAQDSASLKVSETNKITIVPNAYDNQSSQFTLLDVTYADPTDSKNTHVFHLYVPVLVKKVLYISFKTRFIAGTDYCAADYLMNDNATNHYATAGFNEPLTAYIEYSYEKETDWQSMLDNGENLLWYYDKVLDLASGSNEESEKKLLPTGTRLTLVDRQTMQYYTYTTTGEEDFHEFNLSNLQLPSAESSDTSENKNFKPVYICDLLGLTATQADSQDEAKTYYVKVDNKDIATVRVGNEYYRKAEEKDKDATKYSIAISKDSSSEQEARKESYFLTIQVPANKEYSVINNRLNYSEIKCNEGTLPAVIKSEKDQSGSAYVIYDGVSQTFTISTSRIHNGNIMGDTAMEDSDSIKINLESKLKLTAAGIGRFDKLGPSEVYHQFTINLKKYLQGKAEEYDVIGTEIVNYTYTFKNADETWTHTETGTISDAAGKDILSLQYGSNGLKKELEKATDDDTAITVTAEITLTYAGADKFPVRNTADYGDNSGICVVGVSRIANTQTQLPITENKHTEDDKNRYYSTNPSKAKLTYSAVDQTAMGDTTQQLGINPSDTVNPADIIYTKADYDYSNVDETILDKAQSISYKMELFQKNDLGLYDETKPLIIQSYLQNIVKESSAAQESAALRSLANDNYICWNENFVQSDSRHQIARFQYAPLTGEAFEKAGHIYANYRVRVTAVLLDEAGKELEGTKATDYIIYTNARIYQEIIMGQN